MELRLSVPLYLDGLKLEGYFKAMMARHRKRNTHKSRGVPSPVSSGPEKFDESPRLARWLYETSSDEALLRSYQGVDGLPAGK